MLTPSAGAQVAPPLTALVRRHRLSVFFCLVFILTWPLQIVDALGSHGWLPIRVPLVAQILLVAYMPTLAAVLVAAVADGRSGVRQLLRSLLIWRVSLIWYLLAVLGFGVICTTAILVGNGLTDGPTTPFLSEGAAASGWTIVLMAPALFLVTTLVNGEELAWRGYALPRLQARYNAVGASIVLGAIWILFHLPLWLTYRGTAFDPLALLSWSLQLMGASIIFTWLFNQTRGSVLLAYLLHGSINTWTRVLSIETAPPLVGWLLTTVVCLVALGLVAGFGARDLRRGAGRIQVID